MQETKNQPHEYYIGEVVTQKEITVAKPDGTAISIHEALVEILNMQEKIIKLLKQNL